MAARSLPTAACAGLFRAAAVLHDTTDRWRWGEGRSPRRGRKYVQYLEADEERRAMRELSRAGVVADGTETGEEREERWRVWEREHAVRKRAARAAAFMEAHGRCGGSWPDMMKYYSHPANLQSITWTYREEFDRREKELEQRWADPVFGMRQEGMPQAALCGVEAAADERVPPVAAQLAEP
eukprot:gene19276-1045_t